jgi:DNA polymerase II large subunit
LKTEIEKAQKEFGDKKIESSREFDNKVTKPLYRGESVVENIREMSQKYGQNSLDALDKFTESEAKDNKAYSEALFWSDMADNISQKFVEAKKDLLLKTRGKLNMATRAFELRSESEQSEFEKNIKEAEETINELFNKDVEEQ